MKINKICDYKGNKIGKVVTEQPTEEEIQKSTDQLLNNSIKEVEVEREAQLGDVVNINFEGFLDGTPFDGGKADMYDLELGSHTFIPGFEDQLVGHKKGEDVDVNVTFPENYQAENLKGKAVVFKCKVNAVKEKKVPELNDEFAIEFGFQSAEQMKNAIKEQVFIQKSNKDLNDYLQKVWTVLVDGSDIEIEDEEIKDKIEEILAYYEQSVKQYGATLEQYLAMTGQTMDSLRETAKPEAIKSKKADVIYNFIKEEEKFEATEEEIEKELEQMKLYYQLPEEEIERIKKDNINDVINQILRNKVSTYLIKNND